MPASILKKIEIVTTLSELESRALRDLVSRVTVFGADTDIVNQGVTPVFACVLLDGFANRYMTLPTGQRQITAFQIAGDWIDLNSYFFATTDHAIRAMVPCRVAQIPHARLTELFDTHPRLARILWREGMIDSSVSREWVVNVGARQAKQRMAHLFCELHVRLGAVGLTSGGSFSLPVTQAELADALGVSTVHANRTLQEMRAEKLILLQHRVLTILNADRLREVGQFDATYLHLNERAPDRWSGAGSTAENGASALV